MGESFWPHKPQSQPPSAKKTSHTQTFEIDPAWVEQVEAIGERAADLVRAASKVLRLPVPQTAELLSRFGDETSETGPRPNCGLVEWLLPKDGAQVEIDTPSGPQRVPLSHVDVPGHVRGPAPLDMKKITSNLDSLEGMPIVSVTVEYPRGTHPIATEEPATITITPSNVCEEGYAPVTFRVGRHSSVADQRELVAHTLAYLSGTWGMQGELLQNIAALLPSATVVSEGVNARGGEA